jgi:outer membrane protein assembly factor BamB
MSSRSSVTNAPTVLSDSTLLLSVDSSISLIQISNGILHWRTKIPVGIGTRRLMVDPEKNLVFIKHDQTVQSTAINLRDGSILWQFSLENGEYFDFSSDAQSKEFLFFTDKESKIHIITKDGHHKRSIELEYDMRSGHFLDGNLIIAHSYSDSDRAQHPNHRFGKIISYDLDADSVNWEYDNEYGGYTYAPILLENGIIYAGSTSGVNEFTAINAETGEVIWRSLGQESWAYTLGSNAIYINDGTDLVALNKADGRKLWQTSFKGRGFAQSNVAYLDGYVYHSHSGALHVLEAITGEIVHKISISPDGSQFYNLSAGYGKVFVQSDYALYAYKAWEELP